MKMSDKILSIISLSVLTALAGACSLVEPVAGQDGPLELKTVEAEIVGGPFTKASADYRDLGKKVFAADDIMMLTTIERTDNTISDFSASEIRFKYTAGQWKRTNESGEPDRIYWTDPTSPHTLVAYSTPSETFTSTKWKKTAGGKYYSGLGDLTKTNDTEEYIDFTAGNSSVKAEDMLVSYASDFIPNVNAKLFFHHALASVKVVVNITGFARNADPADAGAISKDMVLKSMPTLYKWEKLGNEAIPLSTSADYTDFNSLYTDATFTEDNQKKDIRMWDSGTDGDNANRTSTFYALAIPGTVHGMTMDFILNYQDPRKPVASPDPSVNRMDVDYRAQIPGDVEFVAGKCTQINISVNHTNGTTTIGVIYVDWEYDNSQGVSDLRKHSLYLTTNSTAGVTTHTETNIDLATWLYNNGGTVKDIDGNDGTAAKPFSIKSALQFLSFKKEIESGYDFDGKYVELDANLVMQKDIHVPEPELINWQSIGDDSHPFNGTFLNEGSIKLLQGEPLFAKLGPDSHIQDLKITTTATGVVGTGATGALASVCQGKVCGCIVSGDVTGGDYTGSICGIVDGGTLFACSHIGNVTSTGAHAGGIVGQLTGTPSDKGILAISYQAGVVSSASKYGGIVGEEVDDDNVNFFGCYYDNSLFASNVSNPTHVTGLPTTTMQKADFVGDRDVSNVSVGLNGALHYWVADPANAFTPEQKAHYNSHYYQYVPANYPKAY